MKHKHHKIPRHAGGTDDPSNIELLSVEEHAEAHRILFEQHGRWQDRLAWLGLSGKIDNEDIERLAQLEGIASYRASDRAKDVDKRRAHSLKTKYLTAKHWKTGLRKDTDARIENSAAGLKAYYDRGGTVWNAGMTKDTDPRILKISERVKRQAQEGNFHCIGDYQRGRAFSDDHRKKLSERALLRMPMTCRYCGKVTSPAMHTRWHDNRCKSKQDVEAIHK